MSAALQQQLMEMVSALAYKMDQECTAEQLDAYISAGHTDPATTINNARAAANKEDPEEVAFELAILTRIIEAVSNLRPKEADSTQHKDSFFEETPAVKQTTARSVETIRLERLIKICETDLNSICPGASLNAFIAAGHKNPLSLFRKAGACALNEDNEGVIANLREVRHQAEWALTFTTEEDRQKEGGASLPVQKAKLGHLADCWSNFATATKPEPVASWVWRGWIREGLPALLVGHGEAGKGLLATGLALSVAAGTDFLGHPCQQGKVLFISAEDDREEMLARLHDIAAAMDLGDDVVKNNISVFSTIDAGVSPSLLDKNMKPTELLQEIKRAVLLYKPVLIILDTLAAMAPAGGNLTDATIATQYICYTVAALKDDNGSGPAVLMTHHLRKPGKEGSDARPSIHDVRDSGAIVGSMRGVMILHKDTLTLDKCNGRMRVESAFCVRKNDAYQLEWITAPGCKNGALQLNGKARLDEMQAEAEQREADNTANRARMKKEDKGKTKPYSPDSEPSAAPIQPPLDVKSNYYEAPVAF